MRQERAASLSLFNRVEAAIALHIINCLVAKKIAADRIGVICMYKQQKRYLGT